MPTLQFKGKTFVQNHHLAVKYHQLVPDRKLSLTDKVSLHDNLIIQGDNLKALKALLPTYSGKINCIYIDPPYNTGNENWQYNDNVNSPMIKDWLGKVVDKEDLTRHDKWLCMMMPRLKLLRELLSEDGVIFISIDDNEQHNLRHLLDEVFNEINFISSVVWQKKVSPSNDAQWFSYDHEYLLVYAKSKLIWRPNRLKRNEKQTQFYTNPDNDPRGPWNSATYTSNKTQEQRPNLYYGIINPNTNEEVFPTKRAVWAYSKQQHIKHVEDNRLYWGKDGTSRIPRYKLFLDEAKDIVPRTIWGYTDVGSTQSATQEIQELFPDLTFETPKPTTLIKRILQLATDHSAIILDSFSGSGTTAQAVLELNKEDRGNRKFILVEQEDYANSITAERVRRVIKGVKTAKNENLQNGLGGSFSYFTLGDPIEMESLLSGKNLPSFKEFARYLFFTATGEEFDSIAINEDTGFIGESRNYEVYMFYKPDIEWLKKNALTLDICKTLPAFRGKQRLVFAPAKYVDDYTLQEHRIDFSQLPYEIYRIQS